MKKTKSLSQIISMLILLQMFVVPVYAADSDSSAASIGADATQAEVSSSVESDVSLADTSTASSSTPVSDDAQSTTDNSVSDEALPEANSVDASSSEAEQTENAEPSSEPVSPNTAVNMPGIVVEDGGAVGAQTFGTPTGPLNNADIDIESLPSPSEKGRSANTPPVAGLVYIVLNPETLKNGQFTSDTMIAWLWSYNGENYTYDPDGDAITNISIGGIPASAVIGNLEGNIGFVTQFSTPAQYSMTYQVQDARGAWSNTLQIVLNIEPNGSNSRPVGQAVFVPSSGKLTTKSSAMISWANYTDPDSGDYIADVRGNVYLDDGSVKNISNYITDIDNSSKQLTLRFPSAGSYEVWFSASDRYGAWSDWSLFTYTVTVAPKAQLSNLNYSQQYGGNAVAGAYWFDQTHAFDVTSNGQSAADYLAQYGQSSFPLSSRNYVGGGWYVSGTFKYDDGTPVANRQVRISISSGYDFSKDVTTDANGNFRMDVSLGEYFSAIYGPNYGSGGMYGSLVGTSHYSSRGTSSYVNAILYISCDDELFSYSCSQLIGVSARPVVGIYVL